MPTGPPGVSPPFTPESKRVLGDALKEALQIGDNFIGPGHQLLALIKSGTPATLARHLSIDQALQAVREHHRTDEADRPPSARSRTGPRLRGFVEVMKAAMARSTPVTPAGSQHILLTLVSRRDTLAGKILAELGVTEEKVRELIETIGTEGTLDEAPPPEVEFRVGGRSLGTVRIEPIDLLAAIEKADPEAAERMRGAIEGSSRWTGPGRCSGASDTEEDAPDN